MDFAKIEKILEKGIEQFQKDNLLQLTPSVKGENIARRRALILLFLFSWSKRLIPSGCSKPMAKRIKALDTTFNEDEWQELEQLKQKVLNGMNKGEKTLPTDEELVEIEKLRNSKKRFNVPERWLPLD